MSSKRVLVSSYYPPEFDRDSGSRRVLDLIELLCADGWKVTFVASNRMNDPRYSRVLQQLGVGVYDGAKTSIEELLVANAFDLALLAFWPVGEIYLPIIRRLSPTTKVIVDSVDLHFLRNSRRIFREAADAGGPGILDGRFGAELTRELNVYAAADAVLTVSRKEAEFINDLLAEPGLSHHVPDKESVSASTVPLAQRRGVVFLGSFRHAPNLGAVEFLCKEIVPRLNPALTARHPIYIVGEGLDDSVCRLGEGLHQVRMVGWVPSVAPYLERSRLSVIPLRFGAGTKRKLLQAAMTGTPTVSTSIGVEGFDLRHGEDVLVADEPAAFAEAITRLLQDSALWEKLSRQGREHLLATHGQSAVAERLCTVIGKVLATKAKPLASSKASETLTPARMDLRRYEEMRESVKQLVQMNTAPNARILVLSHGDEELLKLDGRTGWHFPQRADGVYEGYHPADSAEAIAKLETLRTKGAEYLVIPGTTMWWLDHYWDFQVHLRTHYTELLREYETCAIYALAPSPVIIGAPPPIGCASNGSKAEMNGVTVTASADGDSTSLNELEQAVRLIAFYLPQFHPIPENDGWWGQGFTEWTNVGKAKPLFENHYQPHVPADLGFYDLRLEDSRQDQADLARRAGIHAFCYYHYWFAGKQLLQRPFEEVLRSGKPDFPFCLCWANEPWSRRWNGRPEDVLENQTYSPEDDLEHIKFLLPALADPRAVRVDNKPVFMVYQGRDLPEPARTVEIWRREVERAGLPGLYLMSVETGWDAGWDASQVGFDAKVLFQPQFTMLFESGSRIRIPQNENLRVFDYEKAWPVLANPAPVNYQRYETVCPGWDNSPRTGENAVILHNNSPEAYQKWLSEAIQRARTNPPDHRIVFINAWNEWGEGCHLEPDLQGGHGYLQATRAAITKALRTRSTRAQTSKGASSEKDPIPRNECQRSKPVETRPAVLTAPQREELLTSLALNPTSGSHCRHELFKNLADEDWFWLNTEGCRRSSNLSDMLPSLPDSETQARIIGSSGDGALREGFAAYRLFKDTFQKHARPMNRDVRILDFGCGWGRIIRFFLKDVPAENLTGLDCNSHLIDVCRKTNPWCEFAVNPIAPPTDLPSGSYDLIYLYSVFSHLAEHAQQAWLTEFERLLKPGGIVVATTWHREFITWCKALRENPSLPCESSWRSTLASVFLNTDQELAAYDAGKFVYAPYDSKLSSWSYSDGVSCYGEACVPRDYVQQRWTPRFKMLEFVEDRTKCPQNVIIVQKP